MKRISFFLSLLILSIVSACMLVRLWLPAPTQTPISPVSIATVIPESAIPPTPTVTILSPTPTTPVDPDLAGKTFRDLTYCITSEGYELKMDLYYPQSLPSPAPLVVSVHGGGWTGGDKKGGAAFDFTATLLEHGYVVASINYRLAPDYKFPVLIQDVQCAVRHLRSNAAKYSLDPLHVGAIGGSAGGHLVSLLGLVNDPAPWGLGKYRVNYAAQSSRVQAVVDLFGPINLVNDLPDLKRGKGITIFGASSIDDPALVTYSPISHVSPNDPPFLILHGKQDILVPPIQSQRLYDALVEAGIPAKLVMVKNAGHSFRPYGNPINPPLPVLWGMAAEFFDRYLKP